MVRWSNNDTTKLMDNELHYYFGNSVFLFLHVVFIMKVKGLFKINY